MKVVGSILFLIVGPFVWVVLDGGTWGGGFAFCGAIVAAGYFFDLAMKAAARIDEAIDAILEIRKELAKR